jgi:hypothetical protein
MAVELLSILKWSYKNKGNANEKPTTNNAITYLVIFKLFFRDWWIRKTRKVVPAIVTSHEIMAVGNVANKGVKNPSMDPLEFIKNCIRL